MRFKNRKFRQCEKEVAVVENNLSLLFSEKYGNIINIIDSGQLCKYKTKGESDSGSNDWICHLSCV